MKAANANAQLVVPYANDGTVAGASVADNTDWNNIVIGDDAAGHRRRGRALVRLRIRRRHREGRQPDRPAGDPVGRDDSLRGAKIEASLDANGDPSAKVIVGETGVSFQDTNVPCTPAGALFAAGDVARVAVVRRGERRLVAAEHGLQHPLHDVRLQARRGDVHQPGQAARRSRCRRTPVTCSPRSWPSRTRTLAALTTSNRPGARVPVGAAQRPDRGGPHQHQHLGRGAGHRRHVADRDAGDRDLQRRQPERGPHEDRVGDDDRKRGRRRHHPAEGVDPGPEDPQAERDGPDRRPRPATRPGPR